MNILFIHEVDWLAKVVFDIHSLAEALSLRGHRIYAIDYPNTWKRDRTLDFGSLKTSQVDGVSRAFPGSSVSIRRPGFIKVPVLSRASATLTHYFEIKRTLREKKIDAVVLYSVPTNGCQAIRLARQANIPVVFRSIDILNQLIPHKVLRAPTRFMEKRVYARADMILSLTPGLTGYVQKMGAKADNIKLLLMPVDTTIFHPSVDCAEVRQKWGLTEKDTIILFMGTLFDFSGLNILIPRFHEVLKEVPEAKLFVVGDGPQRAKLDAIIAAEGLSGKVIITGFQPYQTMPQYINLAAVCINTFLTTGATRDIFPGKTVQFLACGKPLIATPLDGMKAVVTGEAMGVIYTELDRMAGEIVTLLKSPERRRRLGQAGVDYVTQAHSYDRIAQQLETRLQEAIHEKRALH